MSRSAPSAVAQLTTHELPPCLITPYNIPGMKAPAVVLVAALLIDAAALGAHVQPAQASSEVNWSST